MVGTASGEVGRNPQCGAARTKTNNGRGAGRDGKLCLRGRGGGGRPWRGVGGRGEARAQLGAPACPPARAVGSSRTGGTPGPESVRPLYSPGVARRRGKAQRGRGLNADRPGSPGNAARRPADVRLLLGLSLVAANFFPPSGEGRGVAWRAEPPGRPERRGACGPLGSCWVAAAGRPRSPPPLGVERWKARTRSICPGRGYPGTCLSSPDQAGRTSAAFISHPSFCSARGNCKTQLYCNGARGQVAWD